MIRPKVLIATVLGLLTLIFVLQNTEVVAVKFLFWSFELSRVILILLATATGFACGYVVARLGSGREKSA